MSLQKYGLLAYCAMNFIQLTFRAVVDALSVKSFCRCTITAINAFWVALVHINGPFYVHEDS